MMTTTMATFDHETNLVSVRSSRSPYQWMDLYDYLRYTLCLVTDYVDMQTFVYAPLSTYIPLFYSSIE
jgi:hypothetical protein